VTVPGAAPVPKPSSAVEGCLPLELSDDMKKQYESGQMCFHFQPKAREAVKEAPGKTA
jgi:hypothetical protein